MNPQKQDSNHESESDHSRLPSLLPFYKGYSSKDQSCTSETEGLQGIEVSLQENNAYLKVYSMERKESIQFLKNIEVGLVFSLNMDEMDFIPTRGSALKRKPKDFEVVSFKSHKPKQKKQVIVDEESVESDQQAPEVNMKRARYEILRFGMSGFDAEKKEAAKIQLAIKLGAKPPKNKCQNYKKLLEEKKKEKEKLKSKKALQQIGKNSVGKSTAKRKSFDKNKKIKKKGGNILDIYGTVKASEVRKNSKKKR